MTFALHALPVSHGIAIGRVHLVSHAPAFEVNHYHLQPRHLKKESSARVAVDTVRASLAGPQQGSPAAARVTLRSAPLTTRYMMLLDDPMADRFGHGS